MQRKKLHNYAQQDDNHPQGLLLITVKLWKSTARQPYIACI